MKTFIRILYNLKKIIMDNHHTRILIQSNRSTITIYELLFKNRNQHFKTDNSKVYLHTMTRMFTVKILTEDLKNLDSLITFN